MQIILGSGSQKEEGFISVDISDKCSPHIVADVRQPWEWASEPITYIKSENLLEHFTPDERIRALNEAHDRMATGGIFKITVPLLKLIEDNLMGAFTDPTHKCYFTTGTFDYWNKNHARGRVFGRDYGIKLWTIISKKERDRFLEIELQK
jgi:hypothetical protein